MRMWNFLVLILLSSILINGSSEVSAKITTPKLPYSNDFYPVGIYWVQNSSDIITAKNNGFNTVIFGYDLPKAFNLPIDAMLTTADNEGIKVIFELSYFLRQNAVQNVSQFLPSLMLHSSIFAWYLIDEPASYINDTAILELQQIIRNTGDSRPTLVNFSNQIQTSPELYRNLPGNITFLSTDPYPQMPSTNFSHVTTQLQSLMQYNENQSILWAVLTAQENLGGYTMHTDNEFRMDATSALQQGVQGILWFTYGDYDAPYYGAFLNNTAWTALHQLIGDIMPITKLMLTQTFRSPIFHQGNLSYAVIENTTHCLLAITNQNYYWNGFTTLWNPSSEILTIPSVGSQNITLNGSSLLSITIKEPPMVELSLALVYYPVLIISCLIVFNRQKYFKA